MPEGMKNAVVEVGRRLPDVTFVWKYEKEDDVGSDVPNLIKSKWTPQNDLLRENSDASSCLDSGKISVFITHGGMNSVQEALHAGTPLIVVGLSRKKLTPSGLFADQLHNARLFETRGVAMAFEKNNLHDADKLETILLSVLENSSFLQNAKDLAKLLNKRPFSPRDLLVKNVAFVAENGPLCRLSPISTHMSFVQRYFLDALALVGVVLVVVCSFTFLVIQRLNRVLACRNQKAKLQ